MLTEEQMQTATLSELVAEYNQHAKALDEALVVKFSDRKSAVRRLLAIQERALQAGKAEVPSPGNAKAPSPDKPKAPPGGKEPASREDRSAAIAKSWQDPEVRQRRASRHAVEVDGKEYRSVRAAFAELGLPMSAHIAFRMKLKAAGTMTYEGMTWKAIEA